MLKRRAIITEVRDYYFRRALAEPVIGPAKGRTRWLVWPGRLAVRQRATAIPPSSLRLPFRGFFLQIRGVDGGDRDASGTGKGKGCCGLVVFHDLRHHGLPCAREHRAIVGHEFSRF